MTSDKSALNPSSVSIRHTFNDTPRILHRRSTGIPLMHLKLKLQNTVVIFHILSKDVWMVQE